MVEVLDENIQVYVGCCRWFELQLPIPHKRNLLNGYQMKDKKHLEPNFECFVLRILCFKSTCFNVLFDKEE